MTNKKTLSQKSLVESKVNKILKNINVLILVCSLIFIPTFLIYVNIVAPNSNISWFSTFMIFTVLAIVSENYFNDKKLFSVVLTTASFIVITVAYVISRNWFAIMTTWCVYFSLTVYQFFNWYKASKHKNGIKSKNFELEKLTTKKFSKYFIISSVIVVSFVLIDVLIKWSTNGWVYHFSYIYLWYYFGWLLSVLGFILLINRYWQAMLFTMLAAVMYIAFSSFMLCTTDGFDWVFINWIVFNSIFMINTFIGLIRWRFKENIVSFIINRQKKLQQ